MMVTIAQRFEMSDLQPEGEVEVLVTFVRIIPCLGVIVCDGDKAEEEQAECGPRLP
jgi:hypothetical protein